MSSQARQKQTAPISDIQIRKSMHLAQPAEVAQPVVSLASDAATYVTGEILAAGGGLR